VPLATGGFFSRRDYKAQGIADTCLERPGALTALSLTITGGQGRNRTADAGLFRAAYRIAEVV